MLLTMLVAVAVATPFLVLVHELGHAAMGLATTEGLVHVRVGRSPALVHGRVGRLEFSLNPVFGRNELAGLARTFAPARPMTALLVSLGGPFANLIVAALMLPAVEATHGRTHQIAFAIALTSFIGAVANLVPSTRHGYDSDGRKIAKAWRRRHASELTNRSFEETRARWLVLFTKVPESLRDEARGHCLRYGAAVIAGRYDEFSERLRSLVLAGWCWRHVEEGGDPGRLSAELCAAGSEVVTRAMQAGQLPAEIALRFLAKGGDPGEGSPGATSDERRAFLENAAAIIVEEGIKVGATREQARHAFAYGVALHDAEQIVV